jgi:hypothetical protein
MNRYLSLCVTALAVAVATLSASAQEVIRKEAPPEIRALFQALTAGANGDAAAWEAFAHAHFAPSLLKQQTPAQRAEVHRQIADRFGSISVNAVKREGPDAPLHVMVKGAKGDGVLRVELEFDTPKIVAISVAPGAQ